MILGWVSRTRAILVGLDGREVGADDVGFRVLFSWIGGWFVRELAE